MTPPQNDDKEPQASAPELLYNQNNLPCNDEHSHENTQNQDDDLTQDWNLNCPQDHNIDEGRLHIFQDKARALGLNEEQAQSLLNHAIEESLYNAEIHKNTQQKDHDELTQRSYDDAEFGGQNFETAIPLAQKALGHLANDELIELLEDKGLGNHPEIIRLFYRIGQHMDEDHFIGANPSQTAPAKSVAEILYGRT